MRSVVTDIRNVNDIVSGGGELYSVHPLLVIVGLSFWVNGPGAEPYIRQGTQRISRDGYWATGKRIAKAKFIARCTRKTRAGRDVAIDRTNVRRAGSIAGDLSTIEELVGEKDPIASAHYNFLRELVRKPNARREVFVAGIVLAAIAGG